MIAARSTHAVETKPPARSSVFEPIGWAASPGLSLPDLSDVAWHVIESEAWDADLEDEFDELRNDWSSLTGTLYPGDLAFGYPVCPTGTTLFPPDGEEPSAYHHLLQLDDHRDQWATGGDGGWMHWSIPTEALRQGDFSKAISNPDIW